MRLSLLLDWLGHIHWQREIETAALSECAFNPDMTIHQHQQLARDRQTEARPRPAFFASAGSLPELFKYLVDLLWRDGDALILYPDRHFAIALFARAQRYRPFIGEI